jgi:Family of unknown function (DUF695)
MYSWATAERTHEGFPLFLRRPTDVDTPEHRQSFSDLLLVTHTFAQRLPDGRPESNYDRSLEDMDIAIVRAFDATHSGVPVLVETFGGERNYYFYVASSTEVSAILTPILAAYPEERLAWEVRPNNNWRLLDRYAKEFFYS